MIRTDRADWQFITIDGQPEKRAGSSITLDAGDSGTIPLSFLDADGRIYSFKGEGDSFSFEIKTQIGQVILTKKL